jgi:hypothetical protein
VHNHRRLAQITSVRRTNASQSPGASGTHFLTLCMTRLLECAA